MVDKIFGIDFPNEANPLGSYLLSVNTGSALVDITLQSIVALFSLLNPWRNLLINGDMQVAQRGTSVAGITTTGFYTLDRWPVVLSALGTWTQSQTLDAPTGSGLRNCLKMLVTTADAAPAATDVANLQYRWEGQNLQHLRKGTASAKQLTISFWVKASTTGTYIAELVDNDNNRHVCASYSISSANTWEQKTITFPADTSGVLDNDSNSSLYLNFYLAAGSNFTSGTLDTTWATVVTANRAVGQTNLAAAINNYLQITGVQPETGSVASEFEFTPFDINLFRCKRYYRKSFAYGTAPATNIGINTGDITNTVMISGVNITRLWVQFDVPMRATPTITIYNPQAANNQMRDVGAAADCTSSASNAAETGANMSATQPAGSAVGNRLSFHYAADAELS